MIMIKATIELEQQYFLQATRKLFYLFFKSVC